MKSYNVSTSALTRNPGSQQHKDKRIKRLRITIIRSANSTRLTVPDSKSMTRELCKTHSGYESENESMCTSIHTIVRHTLVLDKARDLLGRVGIAKLWRRIIASFCGVDEYGDNANDI